MFYSRTAFLTALIAGALVVSGCIPRRPGSRVVAKPPPHVAVEAKEVAGLSEADYLKRKATLGSRAERFEALDVMDRSGNPDFIPFFLERLDKEDDDLLRVRVMRCLSHQQDVRAVLPLRRIARWRTDRTAVEAVVTLYELGDDSYIPKLIRIMRETDQYPELSGVAYRTLKRVYQADLPATPRTWNTYYRSHRLAPYQSLKWYANFSQPLPPVVAGTTRVVPRPQGGPQLPLEEKRVRQHIVSVFEFWKPDEP